jgi:hypothetical protein
MTVFENQRSMARKHFAIVKVFHSSSSHDITDPQRMYHASFIPDRVAILVIPLNFCKELFPLTRYVNKKSQKFPGPPFPKYSFHAPFAY